MANPWEIDWSKPWEIDWTEPETRPSPGPMKGFSSVSGPNIDTAGTSGSSAGVPEQPPQEMPSLFGGLGGGPSVPSISDRRRTERVIEAAGEAAAEARQPVVSDPFAGESLSDTARRRGQQFMQGLAEVPASVPESLALAGAGNPNESLQLAIDMVDRANEQIAIANERLALNPDAETRQRIEEVIAQSERQIAAYQPLIDEGKRLGLTPRPAASQRPLYKAGEAIRTANERLVGPPDPRDDSFWGKLASGGGSMVGFVATTLIGGPVAGAGAGASLNSSSQYRDALASGATEEEAMQAALYGGVLGTTEVIPISRALNALPEGLRRDVSSRLARRLIKIGKASGEEAVQEAIMGIGNNLIAKGVYDPERGVMDDVGEQALIGAILGGGIGAVTPSGAPVAPPRERDDDPERLNSPHLTESDRASPLPNALIDDGKAKIDAMLRSPSQPNMGVEPITEARGEVPVPRQEFSSRTGLDLPYAPEAPSEPSQGSAPPSVPDGAVPLETLYEAPETASQPAEDAGEQPVTFPEMDNGQETGRTIQLDPATRETTVVDEAPETARVEDIPPPSFGSAEGTAAADSDGMQTSPQVTIAEPAAASSEPPSTEIDQSDLSNGRTPERAEIEEAAAETEPEPTDAQKEAENYRTGKVRWNGLELSIENAKGSERSGTDPDGNRWSVTMPAHYGRILKTEGADNDHVDIYVGDNPKSDLVVVVDQVDPDTRRFDEHKAIVGTASREEAGKIYLDGFSDGRGRDRMGGVTTMTVEEFKDWVRNGDTTKPLSKVDTVPVDRKPTPRREILQKRPLAHRLKAIGVQPGSPLAAELKSRGITAQTHPGLFKRDGRTDWDNIPAAEWEDYRRVVGEDGNGYLSQDGLIAELENEMRGEPTRVGRQAELKKVERAKEEIQTAIDVALEETGLANVVTPEERNGIARRMEKDGADPEELLWMSVRDSADRAETTTDAEFDEFIPWHIDEETGSATASGAVEQGSSEQESRSPTKGRGKARTSDPQRSGTKDGGATDVTPEGEQTVIAGAERISDRALAEREQDAPLRGGTAPPPSGRGDLFGDPADRADLFDERAEAAPTDAVGLANRIAERIRDMLPEVADSIKVEVRADDDPRWGNNRVALEGGVEIHVDAASSGGTIYIKEDTPPDLIAHEFRHVLDIIVAGLRLRDAVKAMESTREGNDRLHDYLNAARDSGVIPNDVYFFNEEEIANGLVAAFWADPSGMESAIPEIFDILNDSRMSEFSFVADMTTPTQRSTSTADVPTAKIEDFGEKIAGAQKDKVQGWLNRMGEVADDEINTVPLSKSWPEPDYATLIEEGADPAAVAFIHAARDEIPNKPRQKWKVTRWAEQVRVLREFSTQLIDGTVTMTKVRKTAKEAGLGGFMGRVSLYEAYGHEKSLKGVTLKEGSFSTFKGERFDKPESLWVVQVRGSYVAHGKTEAEAITNFVEAYDKMGGVQERAKGIKFEIRKWRNGKTFIGRKIGSDWIEVEARDNWDWKEARKYLAENQEALEAKFKRLKQLPPERGKDNSPRVGEDHRNGQDVTPEMFTETFGFRGVQFGNYVEGPRRQQDLNEAYDGLMDLAAVIGMPPKAMSLNGSLGLAFGARGSGRRASAHYEPGQIVINLTKGAGAGSLAHEWWHGLDHYFGRQGGKTSTLLTETGGRGLNDNIRPEVVEEIKGLMTLIRRGALAQRSKQADKRKSKPYYSKMEEMTARSFESYVIGKLQDQSAQNDYLANILSQEAWEALEAMAGQTDPSWPYVTASEMPAFREAFDKLFDTIETKETDKGVMLFQRSNQITGERQDDGTLKIDEENAQKLITVMKRLRKALDKMGLKRVNLQFDFDKALSGIQGAFEAGADGNMRILIAFSENPDATLRHEVIHALKAMNLFTEKEWAALTAEAEHIWMRKHKIAKKYPDLPRETQIEEAIAEAFGAYEGRAPNNLLQAAFAKMKRFFRAVRAALTGQGVTSIEDIFTDIAEGRVGARDGDGSRVDQEVAAQDPRILYQRRTDRKVSQIADEPLSNAVDDATPTVARQEGFLRAVASQPIDMAFRIPFAVIGGLDAAGRWKVGVKTNDVASRILTKKTFRNDGKFSFLNPIIETVRAGIIDRHGLPEEYVNREYRRGVEEAAIVSEGAEHLTTLMNNDIGPEEAKVLQGLLTDDGTVAEEDMAALAEPIRKAIDDLGSQAVELGLISRESYERNRGSYLHRVYEKHEMDDGAVSRWLTGVAKGRRVKIQGDQFKGRGLFQEVKTGDIFARNKEFGEAKRGAPQKGDRVIIFDKMDAPGQGELEGIKAKKPKTLDRVYWPAERDVPAQFRDYQNRGEFEVREVGKGRTILWRDFTKPERQRMGEILDARYTIGKTYSMMAHDIATGRFFKDIAENEEWSRSEVDPQDVVDADPQLNSGRKRLLPNTRIQWVLVPDTKIPNSDAFRYGALAGRYVRADIWRDMEEIRIMQTPGFFRKVLIQWKINKTARSPVVHMNNVMSNFMFMDMADVRIPDLIAGIRSMAKADARFIEARDAGAFGADMVTQELRQNVLKPLLKELRDRERGGKGGLQSEIGNLGFIMDKIVQLARGVDRRMVNAYQLEDQVFRMGMYLRRRQQGFSAADAAIESRDQFLNYDIRAPWINAARATVLPFLAYTYRAIPRITQTLVERPWKLAKYSAVYYALNMLAYTIAPSDFDEEEERGSFQPREQGKTYLQNHRLLRMPWLSDGNPVFLDIRRWIPAGDVFDISDNDVLPPWLHIGGPIVMGMEMFLNKNAFFDNEIYSPLTDTKREKVEKLARHAYQGFMPSAPWIPKSWYWEKIARANRGQIQAFSGEPYSVGEAWASAFGIKLKPKDIDAGYGIWDWLLDRERRALDFQKRRLKTARNRKGLTQEQYRRQLSVLEGKMERLKARRDAVFQHRGR